MNEVKKPTICIIGGGAAGFFGAITCAENIKEAQIIIIEQNQTVLNKVKISGGGRCNVTHACFDPKELVMYYPRGHKELLGPFFKFQPKDIFDWFDLRGVELKIEKDNRVFPISDKSTTIIDCLIENAKACQIQIWNQTKITDLFQNSNNQWNLRTGSGRNIVADAVLVATGSSPFIWDVLGKFHEIVEPVPSLFTFNIQHAILSDLQGISMANIEINLDGHKIQTEGPLLITHWGLSGPAVLKMSAWGARLFHAMNYRFTIHINWTGMKSNEVERILLKQKFEQPKKQLINLPMFEIPFRLWKNLLSYIKIDTSITWSQIDDFQLQRLKMILTKCTFKVNGKSTFKEEFVTAGGIVLEEVDFRTMASKKVKNLYFAGEVLDIDALTGGFNFQAAWTTAYLAGTAIAKEFS